jgi:putative FmdB family regulatory protein
MPTYVYSCDACGAQFEQFQSFKDEPLRTCPACTGAVRRVFQPVGIVFKGSGWYITDSRKATSAAVASDDSSAKSETKPTSETKTTSESSPKSEATSDTKSNSASTPATE